MIIVLCHRHVPCTSFQVESKHREQNEQRSWIPSVYKITINQSTNQSKSLSALGMGRRGSGGEGDGWVGREILGQVSNILMLVSMSRGWYMKPDLLIPNVIRSLV